MSEKAIPKEMLFNQIAEALEERQTPDRRQSQKGLPSDLKQDRRKGDRRDQSNTDN